MPVEEFIPNFDALRARVDADAAGQEALDDNPTFTKGEIENFEKTGHLEVPKGAMTASQRFGQAGDTAGEMPASPGAAAKVNPYERFTGRSNQDVIDFLERRKAEYEAKEETDADKKKRERREKRLKFLAGIGDVLGGFHKAYSHARGTEAMQQEKLSDKVQALIDKAKKEREANRDAIMNYAIKIGQLQNDAQDYDLTIEKAKQDWENDQIKNDYLQKYYEGRTEDSRTRAEAFAKGVYEKAANDAEKAKNQNEHWDNQDTVAMKNADTRRINTTGSATGTTKLVTPKGGGRGKSGGGGSSSSGRRSSSGGRKPGVNEEAGRIMAEDPEGYKAAQAAVGDYSGKNPGKTVGYYKYKTSKSKASKNKASKNKARSLSSVSIFK